MKNTYMKIIVAAFVAAFSLIGPQINKVEAAVKEDSLLEIGQPYEMTINQDNMIEKDVIDTEEMPPIFQQSKVLTIPSLKTMMDIAHASAKAEASSEPETEATISLSTEEKDLFSRLVEAEAKGELYEGKVAVATVVLNRVDSPEFPNNVTDVITQVVGDSYAFSPVQNGKINKPASEEAKRAVEEALTRKDRLNDSLYFYNPDIATDTWIRTRDVVTTIGNHVFAK